MTDKGGREPWSKYTNSHRAAIPLSLRTAERVIGGVSAGLERFGSEAVPADSTAGVALAEFRRELEECLGGAEAISIQERTLVELAARQKLLLDVIDGYLLVELGGRTFSKRDRSLYPIVLQRQGIADALARYLKDLGLQRRAKPVESLQEYLARQPQAAQPSAEPEIP